ncbi:hypothetical protein P280DRAFT_468125 [Massarina eburnea CBS 473.64]|uniref:Uncharacterized protein n=1 Tax=Massarina eburnea CBS 473.64 TaxID=1395130 RepID=A0A6A6S6J7_9PLEO|nr:hypothetical protein P280DRAFT_468125 [Massarina eburnea CBS 473.64]
MPTSTRASNKETDFTSYYSKKIPQQSYFPHRRKIVRRRDPDDAPEKKQMTLPPRELRRTETVQDSDNEETFEEDEDIEEGGVVVMDEPVQPVKVKTKGKTVAKRGKKRNSDVMEWDEDEDEEPSRPLPKRRKAAAPKKKRSKACAKVEDDEIPSPAESEIESDRKHRQRRQSTMTQMVDGRRPLPGAKEPQFKPASKVPRRSQGAKGGNKTEKDMKQRTLTQMVPGINTSLTILSDSEEELVDQEAEERGSRAYNNALTQRLVAQGLFQPADDEVIVDPSGVGSVAARMSRHDSREQDSINGTDAEDALPTIDPENDSEDEFHPTQFVEAPVTKTARALRRKPSQQQPSPATTNAPTSPVRKVPRSRFSLLATPERRRIREIPSSQSPAESLISTQHTPHRSGRSPLQRRSVNAIAVAETPSKRKQVKFQEPEKRSSRQSLKRFASTILDSEDEDELLENDNEHRGGSSIGAREMVYPTNTVDIGTETQAALLLIDQACAAAGEEGASTDKKSSEELGEKPVNSESSQKLGDSLGSSNVQEAIEDPPESSLPQNLFGIQGELPKAATDPSQPSSPQVPFAVTCMEGENPNSTRLTGLSAPPAPSSHHTLQEMHDATVEASQEHPQLQDTYPSSPMFIEDSDEEEEEDPPPTPPVRSYASLGRTLVPRRSLHHAINEENVEAPRSTHDAANEKPEALCSPNNDQHVEIPRSPSPAEEPEQESQLSRLHSVAAERQLQSEYTTFSQFQPPGPLASSMNVGHDIGNFSYQETPCLPRSQLPSRNHLVHSGHISQATTVDPTQTQQHSEHDLARVMETPQKLKAKPTTSATTPHRFPNSQPVFVSPTRPPSLVIPSSFPSPSKAGVKDMDAEAGDWSSPVITRGDGVGASGMGKGYSQWLMGTEPQASYEDFSIPAPPPVAVDDEDADL